MKSITSAHTGSVKPLLPSQITRVWKTVLKQTEKQMGMLSKCLLNGGEVAARARRRSGGSVAAKNTAPSETGGRVFAAEAAGVPESRRHASLIRADTCATPQATRRRGKSHDWKFRTRSRHIPLALFLTRLFPKMAATN